MDLPSMQTSYRCLRHPLCPAGRQRSASGKTGSQHSNATNQPVKLLEIHYASAAYYSDCPCGAVGHPALKEGLMCSQWLGCEQSLASNCNALPVEEHILSGSAISVLRLLFRFSTAQ